MQTIIEWNTDFSEVPSCADLLVVFKCEHSDLYEPNSVFAAWKYGENGPWIVNNTIMIDEAVAWAKMPEYRK